MAQPHTNPDPEDLSDTSSVSDVLDTRNDEGWEDVEQDEESITVVSLFDDRTFPNAKEMLKYCQENHGFDIWKLRQELDLDFLGLIKLVNYVRSSVKSGNTQPDLSSQSLFEDEKYLKPVLEDDGLLFSLDDVFEDSAAETSSTTEAEQLREQLASLESQFAAYREQVQSALLTRLEESNTPAESSSKVAPAQSEGEASKQKASDNIEQGYFESYSYNAIHESMIKDTIRTDAYRDFIYDHKDLFKDKVVLDVGCGTGILSMFCAKAGAKSVIAVDNSAIIDKARENVFRNGLQDKVRCLRGKIEEIQMPVPKVDIIVSEWMGYGLLYESMFDSVIYARNRYLAEDGLMVPSYASLRIAPLADSDLKASHIDFWRDVYGFDMTAMLERANEEALVRVVDEKELAAESVAFLELDLHTTQVADLVFTKPFQVKWKEGFKRLEGFVAWFDIIFGTSKSQIIKPGTTAKEAKAQGLTAFSTGPHSQATHWQQVIFLLENSEPELTAGEEVNGEVTYVKKDGKERSLDIEISWAKGQEKAKKQLWVLD